jgi:hypothetical protein
VNVVSTDDAIRGIVRAELRSLEERLERFLGDGRADDLLSIPKAAKVVDLSADTVRRRYLPRLKRYGAGRLLKVSVAELRRLMAEDAGYCADVDDVVKRLEQKRRGH